MFFYVQTRTKDILRNYSVSGWVSHAEGSCKTSICSKTQVDVDGSGFLEFPEFCLMMHKKLSDTDTENELKETFRVFSKDDEGCITAEELKFVLTHLPGKVTNALQCDKDCDSLWA